MSDEFNFDDLLDDLDIDDLITDTGEDIDTTDAGEGDEPKPKKEESTTKVHIPESEEDFLKVFSSADEDGDDDGDDEPTGDEGSQDSDEEDSSAQYFKAVAEGLAKLGKFEKVSDDFKWTTESFLEKFDEWTEKGAESIIEEQLTSAGWGEFGKKMYEDIFIKRVPVDRYLGAYKEAEDFSKIDTSKTSNQKLIVEAYLKSLGQDEEEIYEHIDLLEEKEKLEERAQKYKEKLVQDSLAKMEEESSRREAMIKRQRELEQDRYVKLSETVSEALKKKEINGIPLSANDTKELLNFVAKPAYKLENGQKLTELDKRLLEIKKDPVKWVALGKLIKEDLNVSPIKNRGKDEAGEDIFNFTKSKKPSKSSIEREIGKLFK